MLCERSHIVSTANRAMALQQYGSRFDLRPQAGAPLRDVIPEVLQNIAVLQLTTPGALRYFCPPA
jgi:hypothetical protein